MAKVKKVPALRVVSQHEGFRRTDRAWSKTPTIVKISDLSEDEIKQIKGEPMLIVTEIKVDEEESTAGSEQGSDASAADGEQSADASAAGSEKSAEVSAAGNEQSAEVQQ